MQSAGRLTALRVRPSFRARRALYAGVLGGFRLTVAVVPVGGHRRMARQDGRPRAGIPDGCGRRAKSAGRARSGLAGGSRRRKSLVAARAGPRSLGWVAAQIASRAAGCSGMGGSVFPAGMDCPKLAGSIGCGCSGFGFRVGCRNYRMGGSLGCSAVRRSLGRRKCWPTGAVRAVCCSCWGAVGLVWPSCNWNGDRMIRGRGSC